jgi:hypothetical protein
MSVLMPGIEGPAASAAGFFNSLFAFPLTKLCRLHPMGDRNIVGWIGQMEVDRAHNKGGQKCQLAEDFFPSVKTLLMELQISTAYTHCMRVMS